MAGKRSSKKSASAPTPNRAVVKNSTKPYIQTWRETRGVDTEKWARLELDLGRWAQVAGIFGAAVLGLVAFFVSLDLRSSPFVANFRRIDMAVWFPLNAMTIGLAAFTVIKKVDPFRQGLASAHFLSSLAALVISVTVLVFSLLDQASILDFGVFVLWMYPVSAVGLSLTFISLAVTWEGLGLRKDASIIAAVAVPILLSIIPLSSQDPFGVSAALSLLIVYAAMFVLLSGSLIHLTASAAEPSQKEILKGSDLRIAQLRQDLEDKREALDFKEKAYGALDAELEARRKELADYEVEVEAREKELNAVQAKMDQQRAAMKDGEFLFAKTKARVDTRIEEFNLKEMELKTARAQVDEKSRRIAESEAGFAEREKEIKRKEIDLSSREHAIQSMTSELDTLEARLKKEGTEVDARRNVAIKLEKDLQLTASELRMKAGVFDAKSPKDVKDKMSELLAREKELAQVEVKARQAVEEAKQQLSEAEVNAAALQQEKDRLAKREEGLNAREVAITESEALHEKKAVEVERRSMEVAELKKTVGAREQEYTSLFEKTKMREAEASGSAGEMARDRAALEAREQQLAKWRKVLETETKQFNQKVRDFSSREKEIEQKEGKLSLQELEFEKRAREGMRTRSTPGLAEADADKVFDLREKRLREREEEFQRRTFQKEKEMDARERGLREQLHSLGVTAGHEAAEEGGALSTRREGRLATGTPRLDDLLYGGFPMNANILFVGPAFVGKEVAVFNFIAEGLKSNVPSVIVTTSKPPVEIAKDMAPVLPTFMEYERLGLVRWIDASGHIPTKKLVRDGKTFRVPNATDFEGILSAVKTAEDEFREESAPYFRFAFLTLSSSLSQSDEKSALGFVQRFVNRLRQGKCVAAFAIERGMHTDQQLESLQQLMDGALHFKQDKATTVMSVVGIGDAQTRAWVPYKFTNKSIVIGSFQLERIR